MFRSCPTRVDEEVRAASGQRWRVAASPGQMAESWSHGERGSHSVQRWYAARRANQYDVSEHLPTLCAGPLVRATIQEELPRICRVNEVRRRLRGGVSG